MDTHDAGRGRGGVAAALASITQPTLIVGIDSDVLYPLELQEELADGIPNSDLITIQSIEGHDGFLLEAEQIGAAVDEFLRSQR